MKRNFCQSNAVLQQLAKGAVHKQARDGSASTRRLCLEPNFDDRLAVGDHSAPSVPEGPQTPSHRACLCMGHRTPSGAAPQTCFHTPPWSCQAAAHAGRAVAELLRVGACLREQVFHAADGRVRPHRDHVHAREHDDRHRQQDGCCSGPEARRRRQATRQAPRTRLFRNLQRHRQGHELRLSELTR